MKKILLSIMTLTACGVMAQNFEWVNVAGGSDYDVATGVAIDNSGNVINVGYYIGTVDFDPGVGTTNLTSVSGSTDLYVVKYDSNGNFLWAKSIGADLDDRANAVTVDNSGNILVTGTFWGSVDFDPGVGSTILSGGNQDAFVLKLDQNGNFVWARQIDASAPAIGHDIAVDGAGYVYSVGEFQGTIDLDPGAGTQNSTSAGGEDIYFQKLDDNGTLVAAFSFGGTEQEEAEGIALDASNNIVITGYFKGTANFDPIGTTELTATSNSFGDIFILKLLSNGGLDWVKGFGSAQHDSATDIATDDNGNIYATGFFNGTIDFDPGTGVSELTAVGWADQFVLKLNGSGDFEWAISNGGDEETAGYAIAVTSSGDVVTGGYFSGTTDFDPGSGTSNMSSYESWDAFIQKLDNTGQLLEINTFGQSSEDCVYELAVGSMNEIIATGIYSGTVDFDPGASSTSLTSNGWYDIFTLKWTTTVGLDEFGLVKTNIYPNPTSNLFHVETTEKIEEITIVNQLGQVMLKTNLSEINIQDFPAGIYFVNVKTAHQQLTNRLIKQ